MMEGLDYNSMRDGRLTRVFGMEGLDYNSIRDGRIRLQEYEGWKD